jgi:hypothetical protein
MVTVELCSFQDSRIAGREINSENFDTAILAPLRLPGRNQVLEPSRPASYGIDVEILRRRQICRDYKSAVEEPLRDLLEEKCLRSLRPQLACLQFLGTARL